MTVMESQALTDLLERAGASDADRELWLAERAQGITATEVRDLVIGAKREQDLIDLKLGRKVDSFTGNQYTEWGKLREPVIAAALRGQGIEPESRVFHGEQNSRHLASPDGIGVDFDDVVIVSEIKTAAYDLAPGTPVLAKKGYVHQMQWAMHVTGAARCRFVVEERIATAWDSQSRPIEFVPGEMHEHWIERDQAAIDELVLIADAFLAELDRQRAEGGPVIDEVLDTHAVNYLRAIDEEKRWGDLKREHYAAVVAAGKSQESPLARITYTPEKPAEVIEVEDVDYEAAKIARPDLFAALQEVTRRWNEHLQQHVSTRTVKGKGRAASARITAGKGTRA